MRLKYTNSLTVILDLDTVSPTNGSLESYLIGLLDLPDFRLLRYRDQGPPDGDQRMHEHLGAYAPGWLLITETDDAGDLFVAQATHSTETNSVTRSVVRGGDLLDVPLHFATAHLDHPTEEQTQQVRRDLILRRAAEAVPAPVLVTNRQVLLDPIPEMERLRYDCTAVTPTTALTFVGYWLRARGEYVVHAGLSTGKTDRALFYELAAHVLLPAALRWEQALIAVNAQEEMLSLLMALRSRISSALKVRDRSWAARFTMSELDARDEGIDCVIAVALNLMGAFDSTALLVERLNPTNARDPNVGWHKLRWAKQQTPVLPDLFDVVRRHKPVLDIVRILRNTIHSTVMNVVLVEDTYTLDREGHLALPTGATTTLRNAFNNSGGFDTWQVKQLHSGHLLAEPDRLIDEMIVRSTAALDEMMQSVPIESFLGLNETVTSVPPDRGIFSREYLKNIERQLGLRLIDDPRDQADAKQDNVQREGPPPWQ